MKALTIALALAWTAPALASAAAPQEDRDIAEVEKAGSLIRAGKPADGIALLDPLIAAQEKARAGDRRRAYCARAEAEADLYRREAAKAGTSFVILPQGACYSYYMKGFALIDLERSEEARPLYERALAMAPSNSQFLGEMAEWYKNRRDWTRARALFQRAVETADYSPDDRKTHDRLRGMRGLGFILIEEGKWDEAEALFRQVLSADPNDDHAKNELQYIQEHRGKKI